MLAVSATVRQRGRASLDSRAHSRAQFGAIHMGHLAVRDDQIEIRLGASLPGLNAILGNIGNHTLIGHHAFFSIPPSALPAAVRAMLP